VDIQGGISPFSYQWDFGDGAKSVEAAPWHKYSASGNYTVSVTVTDDKGSK
jgi:PKD repeat protein